MIDSMPASMLAAQFDFYGGPEVLRVRSVDVPTPGRGQVLLRVHATSVNKGEFVFLGGGVRLLSGRTFPKGVGSDFSGTVAAIGDGVVEHRVGDRVWGLLPGMRMVRSGAATATAAEYVTVGSDDAHPLPEGIDMAEAASLPVVGPTALRAVTMVNIAPGERALVRGAAGGVGSVLVQLAAAAGAEVTALVSARNSDYVRGLGAVHVVDYHATAPDGLPEFDVILDAVGSRLSAYRRRLARGGRMVTIAAEPLVRGLVSIALSGVHGSRRIRFSQHNPTAADFVALSAAVTQGRIRPTIGARYPLAEIRTAYEQSARCGVAGKILIDVAHTDE